MQLGYKFSLQNVLDWRRDLEDEAKIKLIQAKERLLKEEQYLQQLIKENVHLKEKAALEKRIHAMRQQDLYKEVLDEKIIQQKLTVEQTEQIVKNAEETLLKAHKDKRVMEKLKEKEKAQYIEKINQEEQKTLDEFSTITYGREAFQ